MSFGDLYKMQCVYTVTLLKLHTFMKFLAWSLFSIQNWVYGPLYLIWLHIIRWVTNINSIFLFLPPLRICHLVAWEILCMWALSSFLVTCIACQHGLCASVVHLLLFLRVSVVYVLTCLRANFSFVRANVPINVSTCHTTC